jgi:hypothetical protein
MLYRGAKPMIDNLKSPAAREAIPLRSPPFKRMKRPPVSAGGLFRLYFSFFLV